MASMPALRRIAADGIVASDDGFSALSESQTLEYLHGATCPNVCGPGFCALSAMPRLRGLTLDCPNLDPDAFATLPSFPALTELMASNLTDDGVRVVARCEKLQRLWLLGGSTITPDGFSVLARMDSLRELTVGNLPNITSAVIAALPSHIHVSYWV